MNRHKPGEIKLKNSSHRCVNACCFGEELWVCVLEKAVLQNIVPEKITFAKLQLRLTFWKLSFF